MRSPGLVNVAFWVDEGLLRAVEVARKTKCDPAEDRSLFIRKAISERLTALKVEHDSALVYTVNVADRARRPLVYALTPKEVPLAAERPNSVAPSPALQRARDAAADALAKELARTPGAAAPTARKRGRGPAAPPANSGPQ